MHFAALVCLGFGWQARGMRIEDAVGNPYRENAGVQAAWATSVMRNPAAAEALMQWEGSRLRGHRTPLKALSLLLAGQAAIGWHTPAHPSWLGPSGTFALNKLHAELAWPRAAAAQMKLPFVYFFGKQTDPSRIDPKRGPFKRFFDSGGSSTASSELVSGLAQDVVQPMLDSSFRESLDVLPASGKMGSATSAGLPAALKRASVADIRAMHSAMDPAQRSRIEKTISAVGPKPKVLFVLGGPGVGKGTQCAKIIDHFPAWAHISAGDCLRAERNDPNSKDGELIRNFIEEGKIVPVEITVKLLQKAMAATGKSCFLIDGFPRNLDNVRGWNEVVGDSCDLRGCLFYEATEDELEKRLLGRGQGREDDNIETIKKRFKTYADETQPIGDLFKQEGQLIKICGMASIEEVWESTKNVIQDIEA